MSRPLSPVSDFSPSFLHISLVDTHNICTELRVFYHTFTQYTHTQHCLELIIGLIKLTLVSLNHCIFREFADCWVWPPGFPSSRTDRAPSVYLSLVLVPKVCIYWHLHLLTIPLLLGYRTRHSVVCCIVLPQHTSCSRQFTL